MSLLLGSDGTKHRAMINSPSRLVLLTLSIVVLSALPVFGSVSDYHPMTLAELREAELQDASSVDIQLAIARKLGQSDQEASLAVLNAIGQQSLGPSDKLMVDSMICGMHVSSGSMEQAEPFCNQALDDVDAPGTSGVSRAVAHNAIGYYFLRRGKSDLAMDQFEQALRVKDLNDEVIKVTILHNRGVTLMLSGFTDLAIQAFEEASEDSKVLAADEPLPRILAYNLGYVQAQAGNHEAALESYALVIPWLNSTGQIARQVIASVEISLSLVGVGRYEDALQELLQWEGREDVTISADTRAQYQMAKGQAYIGLNQIDEAEEALREGIRIAEEADNPIRIRELSVAYGNLLMQNQKYTDAVGYLESFVASVDESHSRIELGSAYSLLADAYQETGQFEKALLSLRMEKDATKQSRDEDFARRLASLSVSNELNLKDQQVYLAQERERAAEASRRLSQFIQLVLGFGAVVLLVLVTLFLQHRSRLREAQLHKDSADQLAEEVRMRTAEVEQALEQKISAEKDRADLEVRLANDEKLRLVGQLTGGVAHDFNNLLTVIQLSSELLLEDLPEHSRKLAADIVAAAESGKAITEGLLSYARQQVLQTTNVALGQFFKVNRSIFERAGRDKVHLSFEVPGETSGIHVRVDAGQLASAIMNLILNAKEASEANGQVRIRCEERGEQVAIIVEDEGLGMSEAEVKHAVEPFYSTKAPAEGSGLGLPMVEGFMNQSGGRIKIRSATSRGTTVTLLFEMCEAKDPNVEEAKLGSVSARGEKILFVEDDEQIRAVGKMSLENAGYAVVTADNGDKALEWLEAYNYEIDMLISDVVMPGSLAGDQLVSKALERKPGLPVLLITGYAASVTIDFPVLLKPFRLNALLSTVKDLLSVAGQNQKVAG
jgi:signal transduction histidine kinase